MRITILFLLGILLSVPMAPLRGQIKTLTLGEAIVRARTSSLDAAIALDRLRASYWEHRAYRASLLPEITFKGTLPSYHWKTQARMTPAAKVDLTLSLIHI